MALFNNLAIGVGNVAERIVTTIGGTVVLADNQILRIADLSMAAAGAVDLRIRNGDLAGPIVHVTRVAAAGQVVIDLRNPIQIVNVSGANVNIVFTEAGAANANETFAAGKLEG